MHRQTVQDCKVLLLNPPIAGERRYGKFKEVGSYLPPYGLLSIAAVLEEHGCQVKVVDADSRKGMSLDDVRRSLESFAPHIIGMTAYSIGRNMVIDTARHIKSYSSALLTVGGPHVMTIPDDLAQFDCFDVLAYGEGEHIMRDIVEYFQGRKDLKDIAGIMYRKNSRLITNPPRPLIGDLDTLPYPAFHLLEDVHEYKPMPLMYKRYPVLTLISGRGCPFNCIFCNSIWGRKVRLNSAAYIIGLVKMMAGEYGIREILFYEDSFCLKNKRIHDLCDMIMEERLDVTWTCSANVRTLDRDLLRKMKKAGCWLISIGVESGNDEVLKFIRKPSTTEEVRRVCGWADEEGMKLRGFFMIGHPVDTEETIRQTIDFAKSLPLLAINLCILQLLPGSDVRRTAHRYGEVNYDLGLGTGHPGETLSFVPKGLTSGYLKKMQRRGYREFFLRPSQIWRLLRSIESIEDVKKYLKMTLAFFRLYI